MGFQNSKLLSALTLIAALNAPSFALADGAALYEAKCKACHGAGGNAPINATYPVIGGLSADAIISAINEYKSGVRNSGQAAVMKGVSVALSEADLSAIAGYLDQQ